MWLQKPVEEKLYKRCLNNRKNALLKVSQTDFQMVVLFCPLTCEAVKHECSFMNMSPGLNMYMLIESWPL